MTAPASLLKAWNLMARKEYGQNFLKDASLAARIVDWARVDEDQVVVDIGAGLGAMTIAAAQRARKVVAVEKDARIVPLLNAELTKHGLRNVEVLHQNILKLDLAGLSRSEGVALTIVGNLPYNISSQVLIQLMQTRGLIRIAVLMFQKELAQRLCAGPGNRTYGRISVMLQYYANVRPLREVPAEMFFPKPKVSSQVLAVEFKTAQVPEVADGKLMERVVQAAFGQRRKTLRNALSAGLTGMDHHSVDQVLTAAGIDPRRRAETLSVEEYVALTNAVDQFLTKI